MTSSSETPRARRRSESPRYLHLFALSSLAIAQPLLDVLGRDPEFFVARRSGGGEILLLTLALVALLPLPVVALVALARRLSPRLGDAAHAAAVGAFAALVALQALTRLALLDGAAWAAAGLALGGAYAWAYRRFAALRTVNTYLGVALVAVPAVFLLNPRILKIFSGEARADLHVSGARTPVVFLLLDELSLTALLDAERQIDAESYPHLAALAREATWFRNAATASDVTELAVPALLTGRMPERDQLPILEDHPYNLFTALGGDYRVWAVEPITRLCPPAINVAAGGARAPVADLASLFSDLRIVYLHLLLPPRYAAGLPVIADRWGDFGRPATTAPLPDGPRILDGDEFFKAAIRAMRRDRQDELRRLVDAFDAGEPRALYFLHVLLPHTPWVYLPSGKSYWTDGDVPGLTKEQWADDELLVTQAYQRYLMQVQFVDLWLGKIVDRLRQLDLYDRSLIVFAADHGVSFRPGDSRRVATATNLPDLIPVPLIVKAPYQREGRVVDRHVSTVDLLPSILDLLDVAPPWPPMDGQSLFGPPAPSTRQVIGKERSFAVDDSLHEHKYATLDWKIEIFGTRPLQAGTHPELFGRKVDEVGWREQSAVTLRFTGDSLFSAHGTFSPAFVHGTLATSPGDEGCCDLAVAVNGTLYATVRTYGSPSDALEFSALLPEEAFGEAENRVEVFRVRDGGARLERLGESRGAAYSLVEDAAGDAVAIATGGRRLPIEPRALDGYFTTRKQRGEVIVSGWAVDVAAGREPERILVFHDGELVYGGFNDRVRAEVNSQLGVAPAIRSAFQFELPLMRVADVDRSGLRVFALSREAASELGFFHTLQRDRDGRVTAVLATNGQEFPVVPGALVGYVEDLRRDDRGLVLRGWAADVPRREPAARILVFEGDRMIHVSHQFLDRPDVAAWFSAPEILSSGFTLRIAPGTGEPPSPDRLVVVAVSRRGEAVRFPLPGIEPPAPGRRYTLEAAADGSVTGIRVPGGPVVAVVPGELAGQVERVALRDGRLSVTGWAADVKRGTPAARVLVFVAGELVHDNRFFVPRRDVAARHAMPELLASGFEIEVTIDAPESVGTDRILVFAVSREGKVSLLPALNPIDAEVH